jgi:subtilisin family serine protease
MIKKYVALAALVTAVSFSAIAQVAQYALPNFTEADCEAKTINLKVKDQYRNLCTAAGINSTAINNYLGSIGGALQLTFPNAKQPDKKLYEQAEKPADITLIYRLKYTANLPLRKVINALTATGLFVYAEPNYIMQKCYTVNDASLGNQYYIGQLKADQAWDVWKGDTNMVIGITDSGVDTNHVDLKPNIKYNYNDPYNGIDDDGDGYIDNRRGWNIWANNDNVYDAQDSHGTFTTGISSAKTDNGIGVAGIGFKCKFLPVRLDDNVGNYIRAYDAVVYAADHGCKVINCSWGSRFPCNFGVDIINYAVINKDVVVIASAGNDNNQEPFYPASFQYVINVAGLQQSNQKSPTSSWGANIDIVAYGSGIYNTYNPNTYVTSGGTSAAAPMVSGAAALLRSYYPTWKALKVAEQLKVTADPAFYSVPQNLQYATKLGKGRLDVLKALTDTTSPSIAMLNKAAKDNNDRNFLPGDTLRLTGLFKNYIRPATNGVVTLTCTSPYATIINNTFSLGNLNQNDTINNNSNPFKVILANNTPVNTPLEFKFAITADGGYNVLEWMADTVNRNRMNIDVGNVVLTVPSNGSIGYTNPYATPGAGFSYKDNGSLFYTSGFMVGQAAGPKVMDNVYATPPNYDADWGQINPVRRRAIDVTSDKDLYGKFSDAPAGGNAIGVNVEHRAFGWAGLDEKFVIVEYVIRSNGADLSNLACGIFTDWEILQSNLNMVNTDGTRSMMYAYSTEPQSIYAGIRLLTLQTPNYYASNNNGSNGSINLYDAFTTAEKYSMLSGGQTRLTTTMGDIGSTLGVGPFNLAAADSFKFAVAYVAGDNLADLQAQSDTAFVRYWNHVWTGWESPVWNNSTNWNWFRVPGVNSDALVPANPVNQPALANDTAAIHNLTIINPTQLTVSGQSQFNINGNLLCTGNGGMVGTQGEVNFNGTTPQTISGINTIHQINIINLQGVTNNPSAVLTINGPLNIQQGDLINQGTLNKE